MSCTGGTGYTCSLLSDAIAAAAVTCSLRSPLLPVSAENQRPWQVTAVALSLSLSSEDQGLSLEGRTLLRLPVSVGGVRGRYTVPVEDSRSKQGYLLLISSYQGYAACYL